MNSAGRILIMPKGEWKAETEYGMLDLVYHNGLSWLARKPAKGIEPTEENEVYWFKFCDFDTVNRKIENLNETKMLLSTTENYSDWTEVPLSENYPSYKYVYIELKDSNDCLMDSVFIPSNMFANYNKGETVISLSSGDMRAYVVTQLASSVLLNKSGGKLVIWGVERIS